MVVLLLLRLMIEENMSTSLSLASPSIRHTKADDTTTCDTMSQRETVQEQ
jgi:hypothetical protein